MRKALWAALAALSICGSMAAQGTRFSGPVIKTTAAIPGATVRVCTETATGTPCAPLASIYSDKALTVLDADSIITADSAGNYGFYAAGGCYKIQTSASGYTTVTDIVCNGTAAGNISVTSISAPQTGNTAPVQIGGVWYPGTASGTALAPTATPSTSVTLSGGSIADGTYYCKVTYVNDNGQTTPSPAATITVSGGGGAARVTCAQNDRLWLSGAYGLRVYFSNDNVNFYLQTPPVSTQDFMIDSTTHYVQISAGFSFTSLTFSGTQPPTTNTATIDPLQVALNATMRQSDYAVQIGELYVPPIFTSGGAVTAHVLTTPLIVGRHAKIKGVMHWGEGQNAAGSSIGFNTPAAHAKKAVIMSFGGFVTIENISVVGVGHAVMFLASSGYQGGHTVVKNCYFKTSDTTNTYAALVFVGPYQYDHHFENVSMRGGKTVIQYKNAAGGLHYFSNARWDAGGNSIIQSIPGWSDPDNGVQLVTQGFGVGGIRLTNIRTEGGTGILFDCVGLGIYFDRVEMSDTTIAAATEAVAKFGTDATYGGVSFLSLKDSAFPNTAAVVGTKWSGTGGTIDLSGNSGLGAGSNSGSYVALDLNNNTGVYISDFSNNSTTNWDPASTGSALQDSKVINIPANTRLQTYSGGWESVAGGAWHEIPGSLAFVPRV
ncbi:MAG: hypothetical protein M1451_08855, partial [Acidobacteria bacterium]|nr:hypothetical protein [Acidobacteriota bacterium]